MEIKNRKIIGGFSFLLGVVLILNSFLGITGYVVAEDIGKSFSSILGLVFVLGGLGLFMSGKSLEYSVSDVLKNPKFRGITKKEAKEIFNESNKKVESGEWIPLEKITVTGTNDPGSFPDGTSFARYWGPGGYLGKSKKFLQKEYKAGKIGKTHEIVRGSEKYKTHTYKKIGNKYFKKWNPPEKREASLPPEGSRVLHRHWEIGQMWDYKNNPRKRN